MNIVRMGIIGMGNAGMMHLKMLQRGSVPGAKATAVVCPTECGTTIADLQDKGVVIFENEQALYASGLCDAVIIATPHSRHAQQTISALQAGLHVLCEKPAGIKVSEARAMAQAAEKAGKIYSLNFNRRTVPLYQQIREEFQNGSMGALRRLSWTSTDWLRVQSYYDSSPWRGTWAGEGGGIVLNQLPHVLDLWQWIFGMPVRLWASCGFGRYHSIEVEDEIHVLAEYANGAKVSLTANTGEAPGIERLEIVGERASIVAEKKCLTTTRMKESIGEFIRTSQPGFDKPEVEVTETRIDKEGDLETGITADFVKCILTGGVLLAPGAEGMASLGLANAILLSAWQNDWVNLPHDESAFEQLLARHQQNSSLRETVKATVMSLEQSFQSS